jgi:hypothetical protein
VCAHHGQIELHILTACALSKSTFAPQPKKQKAKHSQAVDISSDLLYLSFTVIIFASVDFLNVLDVIWKKNELIKVEWLLLFNLFALF